MFKRKKTITRTIFRNINPEEGLQIIQKNKDNSDFVILDVRTPPEFEESHLQQAKLLDYYSPIFKEELLKLDKSKIYLIYCRTGVRSAETLNLMKNLGFKEVYNLIGGLNLWKSKGLPLKKI